MLDFGFSSSGNISKTSSLFTYDSDDLLDSYYFPPSHDSTFVPAFTPPETPDDPLVADMRAACVGEGAEFCEHDTLVTRSLEKGNASLWAYRGHRTLRRALEPGTAPFGRRLLPSEEKRRRPTPSGRPITRFSPSTVQLH